MNKRCWALVGGMALACSMIASPPAQAATARRAPTTDFNKDGYRDLVVGAPMATLNGRPVAGYVTVVYGSARGIDTAKRQNFSQDSSGVPDTAEAYDRFGTATAAADFNGDGYDDLAVSAYQEGTSAGERAGMVTVFFGSASGLGRAVAFAEPGGGGRDHYFGGSMAADDFDGDGRSELAVAGGRSGNTYIASFGPTPAAPQGFVSKRELQWIPAATAAGDVTGDGYGDLLVSNAGGAIALYRGGPGGLGARGPEYADGAYEAQDLAVGDINRDGRADVVVGATSAAKGGAIFVHYGTVDGMTAGKKITQDTAGVPGSGEQPADTVGDQFGYAVAVGDVNRDGFADVAVGAPGEDIAKATGTGAVTFFLGGAKGISLTGVKAWNQNSSGVVGGNESEDRFGSAVALIDHNKDGRADLTIGSAGENSAGGVHLLKGTASGVSTSGARAFGPGTVKMPGSNSDFGESLIR